MANLSSYSNEQLVEIGYQYLFDRTGDTNGVDYYVGLLSSGTISRSSLFFVMVDQADSTDESAYSVKTETEFITDAYSIIDNSSPTQDDLDRWSNRGYSGAQLIYLIDGYLSGKIPDYDITWPMSLPRCPLIEGYNESPQDSKLSSMPDQGAAKIRRRFTSTPTNVTEQYSLTREQINSFISFYENDLEGGVNRFSKYNPTLNTYKIYRFAPGSVYQFEANGVRYNLTLELQIMP